MRYEDLYTRTSEVMGTVLDFLQLGHSRYDFAAAESLGVMGSSELMNSAGRVHWKSVEKSEGFNPLARASQWGDRIKLPFCLGRRKNMQELR